MDGSVSSFTGTFRGTCKNLYGQPLATHHGLAYGYLLFSFCAKGYGLISFLHFLIHVFMFVGPPILTNLIIYSDSLSLLVKLASMHKWSFHQHNVMVSPNWDVLQALVSTLNWPHAFPYEKSSRQTHCLPLSQSQSSNEHQC